MSWWVYAPGDDFGDLNVTYNLAPMFAAALALPEKLDWNEDGSPRMCQRFDRETREWSSEQSTIFGLRLLDEAPASEAAGVLSRAIDRMKSDPDTYRAMNPENGWGDYEGALNVLETLLAGCIQHPDGKIMVH